jgi:putative ABC transport system substrate-binding protein
LEARETLPLKRREFITLLGGAAAAWPLPASAQQAAMPMIGFFRSSHSEPFAHLAAAFRQGLNEAGFVEGQNVAIEYRYADNDLDRLPGLAADLVRRQVVVIVGNSPATLAAKVATATIPIIFVAGGDPVTVGLVDSLNRPSGNVTGVSFSTGPLDAKRLELLHELAPKAAVIAVLLDPNAPEFEAELRDVEAAGRSLTQQILILKASNERELDGAFTVIVQAGAGALLVGAGAFFASSRRYLVGLAARHAVVAIYPLREFVEAGGLISYGTSFTDALSPGRRLCRADSQGRQAGRTTGPASNQI